MFCGVIVNWLSCIIYNCLLVNYYLFLKLFKIIMYFLYLQRFYFKYKLYRTIRRKKEGIDPIRSAFDQMKV